MRRIRGWIAVAAVLATATGAVASWRAARQPARAPGRWFSVAAIEDEEEATALDLRDLNEHIAGENGFIGVRAGSFVQLESGRPIRFWGVNGPPWHLSGEPLRRCARMLARRGVNMVRIHTGYFDPRGEVDLGKVRHAMEIVEALKVQGIYTFLSTYYPPWIAPAPGTPWLSGYDGERHPFAALMFNRSFQERYREWWRALLLTPDPKTGRRLVDEPAVAAVEIQNEDSLLFPTIESLPDEQLRLLEGLLGGWLRSRYGSIDAAVSAWAAPSLARDAPSAGRVALRPLWQIARERTPRDRDTVRFLVEPWPLNSPGQLGQFPAAALLFRRGLVAPGAVVLPLRLGRASLLALEGTPLPQGSPLAEAEKSTVFADGTDGALQRLDPLLHLAGRAEVEFWEGRSSARVQGADGLVDRARGSVRSTTGELALDYRVGLLVIDAPRVQGAVGALGSRTAVETSQLRIASPMETGTVVAVALDDRPLPSSNRILLQVMSEEQATGFRSEPDGYRRRLVEPGDDPWQVREIEGTVAFMRADAKHLRVTALDLAGRPTETVGDARRIPLLPAVLYYLIER